MSRTVSVTAYVDVDVELSDINVEDLVAELESRGRPSFDESAEMKCRSEMKCRIERMYYQTRGNFSPTPQFVTEVRDLLANLYGRAA